jgi:Uma2 family endonuclease
MQAQNTIFADPVTMPPKVWTEDDLERLESETGIRYELVDGLPKALNVAAETIEMAGIQHAHIAVNLTTELGLFLRTHKLGIVLGESASYWMKTRNSRRPDASFIAKDRLPAPPLPTSYFDGAPDLAVEVISPTDIWWEILEKIDEYFASGCRLVWLVSPPDQTVMIYRSQQRRQILQVGDVLDGEDVIPGFTMPVADLFAEPTFN